MSEKMRSFMRYNIMVQFRIVGLFALILGQLAGQGAPPAAALTDAQKQALKVIEADATNKAGPLLLKIGTAAKNFDRNILSDEPNQALEGQHVEELIEAISEGIRARVALVREMVKVLTPEQKKLLLDALEKPDTNPDLPSLIQTIFAEKKK